MKQSSIAIAAFFVLFGTSGSLSAQPFSFFNSGGEIFYDMTTGVGETDVTYSVIDNADPFASIVGAVLAVSNGGLVVPTAATPSPELAALNGGAGPDTFLVDLAPAGGAGFTLAIEFDVAGTVLVPIGPDAVDLATVTYETDAAALAGTSIAGIAELDYVDNVLGAPPVQNVIDFGPILFVVFTIDNEINLFPSQPFVRGDVNGDGILDPLADAPFLLAYGLTGGATPPCLRAADADGENGVIALIDAIYILNFGFTGGPPPPPPFPACGEAFDAISCDASPPTC